MSCGQILKGLGVFFWWRWRKKTLIENSRQFLTVSQGTKLFASNWSTDVVAMKTQNNRQAPVSASHSLWPMTHDPLTNCLLWSEGLSFCCCQRTGQGSWRQWMLRNVICDILHRNWRLTNTYTHLDKSADMWTSYLTPFVDTSLDCSSFVGLRDMRETDDTLLDAVFWRGEFDRSSAAHTVLRPRLRPPVARSLYTAIMKQAPRRVPLQGRVSQRNET